MRPDMQRLREPAAWVLTGYTALTLVTALLRVFAGLGAGPDDVALRAYQRQDDVLSVVPALLLCGAVLLVSVVGPPTVRARTVVRTVLGVLAAQAVGGLAVALAALAHAHVPGSERVLRMIENVGVLVVFALAAYVCVVVVETWAVPLVTRGTGVPAPPGPPPPTGPAVHHAPPPPTVSRPAAGSGAPR